MEGLGKVWRRSDQSLPPARPGGPSLSLSALALQHDPALTEGRARSAARSWEPLLSFSQPLAHVPLHPRMPGSFFGNPSGQGQARLTEREIRMRKSAKVLIALGAGGLALAGGSAFTASNTMPTGSVSGYGQTVSTGATVTGISDTLLSSDASKLASVTFTSSTDVTGKTATMTLKNGTSVVGSPYSCTLGTYTSGTMTITCATSDNPALDAFDTTGLTVN